MRKQGLSCYFTRMIIQIESEFGILFWSGLPVVYMKNQPPIRFQDIHSKCPIYKLLCIQPSILMLIGIYSTRDSLSVNRANYLLVF